MNNFDLLDKWGWINREAFLWWNFEHKEDKREYYDSFKDFIKLFTSLGEKNGRELFITTKYGIPITSLSIEIEKEIVQLMVTARPFNKKEIIQFTQEPIARGVDLIEKLFDENGNPLNLDYLISEFKKQTKDSFLPNHFFPHIRGIMRKVNSDGIFYHRIYSRHNGTKSNSEERIYNALIESKKNYIGLQEDTYGFHDVSEAFYNSRIFCEEQNLIYKVNNSKNSRIREPIKLNKKFELSIYDKITTSENPLYCYYPIKIDNFKESIPFMIGNRLMDKKGFFNVGLAGSLTEKGFSSLYASFYPITQKEVLIESSKKLSEIFHEEVKPVYFRDKKGSFCYSLI